MNTCISTPITSDHRIVGKEPLAFGDQSEYTVRIAGSIEERRQAWELVYQKYREKEYAQPNEDGLWYGLYDALPRTTTFLVDRDGETVATMTLVFDSPLGLPADGLYRSELDAWRRKGRRVCEIVSLVSDETSRRRCVEVLRNMFKLAYLTARRLEQATDFVITVNPHHTAYYQKKLLFRRAGSERSYDKVGGAPAVLLRLDLETAEARYREELGPEIVKEFVDRQTEPDLLEKLAKQRLAPDENDIETWFAMKRPLLLEASPRDREFVLSHYAPSLRADIEVVRRLLDLLDSPALQGAVA